MVIEEMRSLCTSSFSHPNIVNIAISTGTRRCTVFIKYLVKVMINDNRGSAAADSDFCPVRLLVWGRAGSPGSRCRLLAATPRTSLHLSGRYVSGRTNDGPIPY